MLISRFPARRYAGQFKCLLSSLTFTVLLTHSFVVAAEPASLERMKHDTQVLSSDAFEGRAPLTAGEDKAVAYIADAMKQIGLKPGVGESYLQPVPMLQSETLTDPEPRLTVTGPKGSASFGYQQDITLNTARNAPKVNLEGSNVVFVGYGINAPEKHWNDYAGVDVRGKTVIILINDPDWRNSTTQGAFDGKRMTYYGRYAYKFQEAARQGAAAAIVIHSDASAGYPFSVPASSLAAATDVLDHSGEGSNQLWVKSWMTRAAAEKLMQTAGQNLDQLEKAAAEPDFKARPLNIQANFSFGVRLKRGVSKNVIGFIRGSKRPDEYVIYTAHWDHLGHCPPDETGDDICNGAIDNASGVAGLLELARMFRSGIAPDRSIIFLSTTGEEQGLLGSEYYAAHPVFPLAQTVAEIDLDPVSFMLGATRDISLVSDQTELADVVRQAAASQNRVVTKDSAPEQGNRYRSDTLSFARAGVPVVLIAAGLDVIGKPAGWGSRLFERYNTQHYHQPSDAYDPNWDWSGALTDLDFFFRVGDQLARMAGWPNWYPTDEFRHVRDAVRKGK